MKLREKLAAFLQGAASITGPRTLPGPRTRAQIERDAQARIATYKRPA